MQSESIKMKGGSGYRQNLSDRFLDYSVMGIKFAKHLSDESSFNKSIASQFIRSITSCGANYEEACAAESKADFIHKLQIVLKELRESRYWLKLISKSGLSTHNQLTPLLNETKELLNIIAKSVITTKNKKKQ